MRQLNPDKLAALSSFNDELDRLHGQPGSSSRQQFDEESIAWFYGNMLRERRKELNLTQKQVAEKLGREQSYIARVENGRPTYSFRVSFASQQSSASSLCPRLCRLCVDTLPHSIY